MLPTNFNVHDTYFVVAHFHYVMFGGALFMFVGGLHYWWPKITGRMYNETLGRLCCLLEFVGFNLTFFPQFILGLHGMPRRYAVYYPEFQYVARHVERRGVPAACGVPADGGYLLHSLFRGKKAPANPWGGTTLEWTCSSPPPHDNFPEPPSVGRPYDHTGWCGMKRPKAMSASEGTRAQLDRRNLELSA